LGWRRGLRKSKLASTTKEDELERSKHGGNRRKGIEKNGKGIKNSAPPPHGDKADGPGNDGVPLPPGAIGGI